MERSTTRLFPRAIYRVAAVDYGSLKELRVDGWRSILELEARVDEERALAVAHLYALIPQTTDREDRLRLLEAKRACSSRAGAAHYLADGAYRLMIRNSAAEDSLLRLQGHISEYVTAIEAFETYFTSCFAAARSRFKEHLADRAIACGLQVASPELYAATRSYRNGSNASTVSGRHRRREEALVAYYARCAAKTSPFSTFTYTGELAWRSGSTELLGIRKSERRSSVSLNRAALARLASAIVTNPAFRSECDISVNTSLTRASDTLLYYLETYQLDLTHAQFAVRDEGVAALPCKASIVVAVNCLKDVGGDSWDACVRRLAEDADIPPTLAGEFLSGLLERGVLRSNVPVDEFSTNYESRLAEWLSSTAVQRGRMAGDALKRACSLALHLGSLDEEGRSMALAQVRSSLQLAEDAVGVRHHSPSPIYEDAAVGGAPAQLGSDRIHADLVDLRRYGQACGAFSPNHIQCAAYADFIEDRWGVGRVVPILEFAARYFECLRAGEWNSVVDTGCYAREVKAYQVGVEAALTRAVTQCGSGYRVDSAVCDDMIAPPSGFEVSRSTGFFLQLSEDDSQPIKVNTVVLGYGKYFSRFVPLLAKFGDGGDGFSSLIARDLNRHCRAGETLVDIGGVFGTNANVRPSWLPAAIAWPGVYRNGHSNLIPLSEICVRVADGRAHLLHTTSGTILRPFHFGFLTPQMLPRLAALLIDFGPPQPGRLPWNTLVPAADDTTHRGRITFGNLLTFRAGWRFDSGMVPARPPGSSFSEYFLEVNRWRHHSGVPDQVFAIIDRTLRTHGDRPSESGHDPRPFAKRKPQFIDFESPLFLHRIDRIARSARRSVVFEEVYPQPERSLASDATGRRFATELIVQIDH
jgi:hypothetical protein